MNSVHCVYSHIMDTNEQCTLLVQQAVYSLHLIAVVGLYFYFQNKI